MEQKLKKCGVDVFWLCETTTGFAMNATIYIGREAYSAPQRNLGNDLVMNLCSVYFDTGRDIYLDRYFTSHSLVCIMLHQNLKLVGTVIANQREIPLQLKSTRGREVESIEALNFYTNKILLLSYDPKRNRNVLIMPFPQPHNFNH